MINKHSFKAITPLVLAFLFLISACITTQNEVSYNSDIKPIITSNCVPCHNENGKAPFSLNSYADVRKKGKLIRFVTKEKFMPPWPADVNYTHFIGEKALTDDEINKIASWVDAGMPKGNTVETDVNLSTNKTIDKSLSKPDLILSPEKAYLIPGDGKDKFWYVKIPYEIAQDTFVKYVEFVPGKAKILHHLNGHMISYNPDKKNVFDGRNLGDPTQYEDQKQLLREMNLTNDDGTFPLMIPSVANYLPGMEGRPYPDGIGGFQLSKKGAIFIKDIHYGPSNKDIYDKPEFHVYFTAKPPVRPTYEIQMGTLGISPVVPSLVIPPNEVKTFTSRTTVPFDVSLLTINPHMHLLGKSFWAYAIKPSGDTIPLIRIKKWDFRWQYFYTFPSMLKLEKGTEIFVEAEFDNTVNNPFNPFNPPRLITGKDGSMKTTNEMLQFIITYVPYKEGDEDIKLGEN